MRAREAPGLRGGRAGAGGEGRGGRGLGVVHHHLSRERDNGHHPKGRTEGLTARRLCRFTSGRSQGRAHTCPARRSPHQNKARRGTPGKAERGPPALQRVCGQAPTGARFPVILQTLEPTGAHFPCDPANARTHGHSPNPWILSINRNTENTCRKVGEPSQRGPLCRPQETHDPGESAGLKTTHTRVLGRGMPKKRGFELFVSDDEMLGHVT